VSPRPWVLGSLFLTPSVAHVNVLPASDATALHVTYMSFEVHAPVMLNSDWPVAPFSHLFALLNYQFPHSRHSFILSVITLESAYIHNQVIVVKCPPSVVYDDVIRTCVNVIVVCDDSVGVACCRTFCDVVYAVCNNVFC